MIFNSSVKSLILFLTLLFLSALLSGQEDSLVCNGDLIVLHNARFFKLHPDHAAGTFSRDLFISDTEPFTTYDAIAYRYTDHSIYGVDYSSYPLRRLFRINEYKEFEILDTLYDNSDYNLAAGAITADHRYLVLVRHINSQLGPANPDTLTDGRDQPRFIDIIDLESPTYEMTTVETETTGANAGVRLADIAIHPLTNICYGFDNYTSRLITIDPFTGLIDNSSFPPLTFPNESTIGALMFTPFGELIGHYRWFDGETYIQFDLNTGQISEFLFLDSPPSAITYVDGCSCPYTIKMEQTVSDSIAYECGNLEFTTKIAYWLEGVQNGIVFESQYPAGIIIEEVIHNPYSGNVSGIGTSTLSIEDFDGPKGVDSIVVRVSIPDGFPPGIYTSQPVLSGLNLQAANDGRSQILSDYPITVDTPDPTPFQVLSFDDIQINDSYGICPGETIELRPLLGNTDGLQFEWFDGTTETIKSVDTPGDYPLTISNSCGIILSTLVVTDGSVLFELEDEIEVLDGEEIMLTPQVSSAYPVQSYSWELSGDVLLSCTDCLNPIASSLAETTIITGTVTNELGCTANDKIILKPTRPFFAPNAFSPNRDGVNDVFYLQTSVPTPYKYMHVFDRWGALVFSKDNGTTNQASDGWNGLINNKPATMGTYVWQIELAPYGDSPTLLSGDILLLR